MNNTDKSTITKKNLIEKIETLNIENETLNIENETLNLFPHELHLKFYL